MKAETRWLVHQILINNHDARNSDIELYIKYVEATNPDLINMPLAKALRQKDCPNIQTISRERRYWQSKDPDTWSDAQVQAMREELEKECREYYGKKC